MNIIKKLFTVLIALTFISFVTKGQKLKDPDVFLVPNKDSLPKIFLIGTFHFDIIIKTPIKLTRANRWIFYLHKNN